MATSCLELPLAGRAMDGGHIGCEVRVVWVQILAGHKVTKRATSRQSGRIATILYLG